MNHNGLNMEIVKKTNLSSILNYINERGQVSRKDIAQATELTPAAITQICAPLLKEGLLIETGTESLPQGAGRKKINLSLNYDAYTIICINIGTENSVITKCNLKGDDAQSLIFETPLQNKPEAFFDEMSSFIKKSFRYKKISAVCVLVPGVVNNEEGISTHAYGIWSQSVNVKTLLFKHFKTTILVENNVKAFALAELLYGAGKRHESFLTVKWGPGVGSAIVLDNKLYYGREGKAGEIGHFIVDPKGKKCTCGRNGCLETKVSYSALKEYRDFKMEDFGQIYKDSLNSGKEEYFKDAINLFAMAITNAMTVIEPRRVILYGRMFTDQFIVDSLVKVCQSLDSQYNEQTIKKTELFNKEDYIGAAALFLNYKIEGK